MNFERILAIILLGYILISVAAWQLHLASSEIPEDTKPAVEYPKD